MYVFNSSLCVGSVSLSLSLLLPLPLTAASRHTNSYFILPPSPIDTVDVYVDRTFRCYILDFGLLNNDTDILLFNESDIETWEKERKEREKEKEQEEEEKDGDEGKRVAQDDIVYVPDFRVVESEAHVRQGEAMKNRLPFDIATMDLRDQDSIGKLYEQAKSIATEEDQQEE